MSIVWGTRLSEIDKFTDRVESATKDAARYIGKFVQENSSEGTIELDESKMNEFLYGLVNVLSGELKSRIFAAGHINGTFGAQIEFRQGDFTDTVTITLPSKKSTQ